MRHRSIVAALALLMVPILCQGQSATIPNLTTDSAPADTDMLVVHKTGDARAKKTTRADLRAGLLPLSGGILTGNLFAPTIFGSSAAGANLQLGSTSNGTKGSILLGSGSAFSEASGRLGIGTTSALTTIHAAAGSRTAAGEVGGVLVTGATTSERLAMGYETAVGGWLQSILSGTAATTLRLNPLGGNVAVGGVTPTVKFHIYGAGSTAGDYTNGDTAGATLYLQDSGTASGNGGQILFGSGFGVSAGIKLYLNSGSGPAGGLIFQTRTISGNVLNRMIIAESGQVGIGTALGSLAGALDINGNSLRLRTARTIATATTACSQGEISWDASFVYVCVATNTWKRSALSTW